MQDVEPNGRHHFRGSQKENECHEKERQFNEWDPKNAAGQLEEHDLKLDAKVHQQQLFLDASGIRQVSFDSQSSWKSVLVELV